MAGESLTQDALPGAVARTGERLPAAPPSGSPAPARRPS